MCKVSRGSIILCEVPHSDFNPHAHAGLHYYVIVANNAACQHSPVVQAVPCSSNVNRRLPCQCEIQSNAFPRRTFALAEQLTLLPKDILERGQLKGYLSQESLAAVERCIKVQLNLT
ncbi:MAG: type II toxin-antitoxin system PemK/MazF family toxin [Clostridia bacterium]|nr:type II toxin-antitoxin system PemK/MazF family toxin [Clostridia bacterium]